MSGLQPVVEVAIEIVNPRKDGLVLPSQRLEPIGGFPEPVVGTADAEARDESLIVPSRSRIPLNRVDALIQHEIGTHLVTYFNGKAQRFTLLRSGFAGYEELQEGLAVLAEYLTGGMTPARLRTLAARVVGVDAVANGAPFVDVFRLLCRYGFSRQQSFTITTRIYRGGGFIKDCIYLRGLLTALEYLREGGGGSSNRSL